MQRGLSDVTGSKSRGWTLVFSYYECAALSLDASTWNGQGLARSRSWVPLWCLLAIFCLGKEAYLRVISFRRISQTCIYCWKTLAFR